MADLDTKFMSAAKLDLDWDFVEPRGAAAFKEIRSGKMRGTSLIPVNMVNRAFMLILLSRPGTKTCILAKESFGSGGVVNYEESWDRNANNGVISV